MQTAIIYVRKHANDVSSHWILKPIAKCQDGSHKNLIYRNKEKADQTELVINYKTKTARPEGQSPSSP